MKHERKIFNGHVYSVDPYEEPSNEELGIKLYSTRTLALFWWGAFLSGALFWIAVVKGIVWAYSV